jgi:hypothetical protein
MGAEDLKKQMNEAFKTAKQRADKVINGTSRKLEPGIYVGARPLNCTFPCNVGKHQFVVLVPEAASKFNDAKELGGGTRGIVLGAYNRKVGEQQRLLHEKNSDDDVKPLKDELEGRGILELAVQLEKVDLSKQTKGVDELIPELVSAAKRYENEELKRNQNVPYPPFSGQFGKNCINSNSWSQSLVEHTIGKGVVKEDFDGADNCSENRIPAHYFKLEAPMTPMPPKTAPNVANSQKTYVVQPGDTLSEIAHREYGDGRKWRKLHDANKVKVPNPHLIRPGELLVIPS